MRSMWKGAIQFGLVSIPVRMYTATEEKSIRFHQLHDKDHGRIRYSRVCSVDGKEVPYEDIVRGFEFSKGQYVVLTDEDLEKVPIPTSRAIEITQFVDLGDVDPIYFQKTYYLTPEQVGRKPYALLRRVLQETKRVAVSKIAFHEKEHLALIRPEGDMLVLETMYWPDEIREAPVEEVGDGAVEVRAQELQMAKSLIENLTEDWDPSAYQDEYREALQEIIDKKVAGEEVEALPAPETPKVIDLMQALKASLEASKGKEPRRKLKRAEEKEVASIGRADEDGQGTPERKTRKAS